MTLLTNINNTNPINWATSPSGVLFGATGIGNMFKWDGLTANIQSVGVAAPPDAPVIAFSGAGVINGSYTAYLRFVDNLGNVSNVSPVSNTATASSNATITYSGLDLPANAYPGNANDAAKITKRQLLRNTNGQAATYYIDIETTDLTSTTLTSTKTDTQLTAGIAVPSTDLSLHGTPPTHKWAIANHLGRVFAAVDGIYDQGCLQVTNGSSVVTQINGYVGTGGAAILTGRLFYIDGATQTYTLTGSNGSTVNGVTLNISPTYADATDKFASYAIKPVPAERRLIYYSQANLPESWPATNAVSLQEDGDEITGLMPFASFLYVLENRHMYRFTFQSDPGTDGAIFLAHNRGCINQRCWVTIDSTAYLLDEQGIHAFGGSQYNNEPISSSIQNLFRFSDFPLRVNWAASKWFHAVHFAPQEVIRWFVALSGQYLPYHAICYNYRQKRWWIEQWQTPIGASVAGRIGKSIKLPQVYLGSSNARLFAMWQGTLDGVNATIGTVRGTAVADSRLDLILDPFASFNITDNINNNDNNTPVSIVDGRGKGQTQLIVATATNALRVRHPWLIKPDATSVYQVGGIPWRVQLGWWRTLMYEQLNERYFTLVVQPLPNPALATMQMFTDFSVTPTSWRGDFTLKDGNGVRTVQDSPDVVFDLTKTSGYFLKRLPGHREFWTDGARYVSFAVSGVQNTEQQFIYNITAGGFDQSG